MGTMSWQHRYIFHFDQMGPIRQCHLINISSIMQLLDLIQKLQHWLTTLTDSFHIRLGFHSFVSFDTQCVCLKHIPYSIRCIYNAQYSYFLHCLVI